MIQNKDPNIQKQNSVSLHSIYKGAYKSSNEKLMNVKPINTFERFLKNLSHNGSNNNSYHQTNSNVIKPSSSNSA